MAEPLTNMTPSGDVGTRSAVASPSEAQRALAGRALGADRPSLKVNFGWALAGNLVYQATQWLVLVALAKLLDVAEVGRFALALAICTPITTFSALNLRAVQITDARNEHPFGLFLALQLCASAVSSILIAAIGFTSGDASSAWLVVLVGVTQAIVIIRDVFIAFNQKHERMDAVAASQAIIGFASLVALTVLVWATGSLLVGVIGWASAKLMVFLLWDLRGTAKVVRLHTSVPASSYFRPIFDWHAMLSLAWLALPLGIASILLSIYNNVPRYLVVAYLGEEQLGYFAAIMALAMAGTMVTNAAGLSAAPRLSRYYIENRRAFGRLLAKLMGVGLVLGVAGLAIVFFMGRWLLQFLFTVEYGAYYGVFLWSMLFAALAYVVSFLGFGITAMRRFKIQQVPQLAGLIVALGSGMFLIPRYELVGAAACLIVGKLVQGGILLWLILRGLKDGPVAVDDTAPVRMS